MPKRTDRITDLEKYFWKAESIQKLLGTDHAEKLLKEEGYKGKTDIGSKEFVRVASEFGHLEHFYQKRNKNENMRKSGSEEPAHGRPTYLFQKCLACRIITQLNAETKVRLARSFDKIELGRMVLSKEELKLGIWDMVTDSDLIELLQTQCYFQTNRTVDPDNELTNNKTGEDAGDVSPTSQICWMHDTDKCSPQTLLDLCSIFKQGRGKGITAFTYTDLNNMSQCFYALFPGVFSENGYIRALRVRTRTFHKNAKEASIFSSDFILRHGMEIECGNRGMEWAFVKYLKRQFREYFVKQFRDKDRANKWFERLTKKYRHSIKYSRKQDSLYPQVQKWYTLWKYVICRYKALRREEEKQTKGAVTRMGKVKLEVLLGQIGWEYSHQNVCEDTERKGNERRDEETYEEIQKSVLIK